MKHCSLYFQTVLRSVYKTINTLPNIIVTEVVSSATTHKYHRNSRNVVSLGSPHSIRVGLKDKNNPKKMLTKIINKEVLQNLSVGYFNKYDQLNPRGSTVKF